MFISLYVDILILVYPRRATVSPPGVGVSSPQSPNQVRSVKSNLKPYSPGCSASDTQGENDDSGSQGIESASDNERATAVSRFGVLPRSAWVTYMGCVIS